jgi:predicted SAM-dependent methyltransferase
MLPCAARRLAEPALYRQTAESEFRLLLCHAVLPIRKSFRMLASLIKGLFAAKPSAAAGHPALRLHIGGRITHPDWKIFNIEPGPNVDFVGHCADLSRFADASVLEIYASHVIEHLGYHKELPSALREFHRVLVPGGLLRVSVPDLDTLCRLFLDRELALDQRARVMQMMFGAQSSPADFHYVGLNEELLRAFLGDARFTDITRVEKFGLFDDASNFEYKLPISLNMSARKAGAAR